jgi:hypothetical protein
MDDKFAKRADKLYGRHTKVTRYLCAGVYLDRLFRDKVIREVYNDSRHRVAPSYGFDLVPVVAHARRAWVLDTAHQAALLAALALSLLIDFEAAIVALCIVPILPLLVLIARSALTVSQLKVRSLWHRLFHTASSAKDDQRLRQQARRLLLGTLGVLGLAAIPGLAANAAGHEFSTSIPRALVVLGVILALAAATGATRQCILNKLHRKTEFRPTKLTTRLQVIDEQQSSVLVVYSRASSSLRDPTPFVGGGNVVRSWPVRTVSLTHDESKQAATVSGELPTFYPHELVDFLRKKTTELGAPAHGPGLTGLYVRDRLFVPEEEVGQARHLLGREPSTDEIEEIIAEPYSQTTHYLEIGASRTGEVVTTVFIRLAIISRSLNIEVSVGALARPPEHYGVVDAYREQGSAAIARAVFRALLDLPQQFGGLWRLGVAPVVLIGGLIARTDRTLVPRRGTVIGPQTSIREEVATRWKRNDPAFDGPEIDRHKNLILQAALDAIAEFLESRGIDTSAFRGQITNIINTSVLNTGTMKVDGGAAIGNNAQVIQQPATDHGATNGGTA